MRYCAEQGCKTLISSGRYCEDHKRRKKEKPVYSKNKSFYHSQAWHDLRAYVYQRDKGCCVRCGRFVFGKRAHAHHIIPINVRPDLKLDPDNVVIVCDVCHPILEQEANEKYGFKQKKQSGFNWKL